MLTFIKSENSCYIPKQCNNYLIMLENSMTKSVKLANYGDDYKQPYINYVYINLFSENISN